MTAAPSSTAPDLDRAWREIVDDLTRRGLLGGMGALGLGVLVACGRDATSAPAATASPRMVTDLLGTHEIPADVSRVVCLGGRTDIELAALCGYEVIAYYDRSTEGVPYPDAMQAVIADDAELLAFEPDLEVLVRLAPDLILTDATEWDGGVTIDMLREIAPVLVTARVETFDVTAWRSDFEYFAQALGKADRAAEFFTTFDDTLVAVREQYGPVIASAGINLLHDFGDGTAALSAPRQTLFGLMVTEVGGHYATRQAALVEFEQLSPENLDVVQGDVIVRTAYDLAPGAFDALEANPLWAGLPAVEAGRVVDAAVLVTNFGGPLLATACLDLVAQAYARVV